MEKRQKITVELGCDNSALMAALDEVEKKVDLIASKLETLCKLSGQDDTKEDH